jgi:two-component system NarL family sensor kinase
MADIPEWQKSIHRKKVDSLQQKLQNTTDVHSKIDILNEIPPLLWDLSLEEAYNAALKANHLSLKEDYLKGQLDSYTSLAIIAEMKKEYRISIFYWEQAILFANKIKDLPKLSRLYVSILNSCFYLGDYRKILDTSIKGIPIAQKANDLDAEIHFTNSIGFVFIQQQNYQKALMCYQRSSQLALQLGNVSLIGKSYCNSGKVYNLLGKQPESIESYEKAINVLYNTDWIGDYGSSLNGIAKAYLAIGNTERALYYALKCYDFVEERGGQNRFDLADYHLTLGEIYFAMHTYDLANKWIFIGLKEAINIDHKEFSKRGYKDLSDLFAAQKKYDRAFEYQVKYIELKDSLSSIETTKKLVALESQAEIDKRDYDIQMLSTEYKLNQIEHRRNNFIAGITIGLIVLLAIILFLIYNRYRLQQKNKLLAELGNQQIKMFNTVVSLQDKERKRIAEDLHDGLGSTLSTIQLNLERLKDKTLDLDKSQQEQYNLALSLSNEAVKELRNVAHNLMPSALTKLGLIPALQNHIDQIQKHSGIDVNIENHGLDRRLEPTMEMSIFRIMLEIMNNIVKHSKAKEVVIQFVKFDDRLNITVEDNGIGFDTKTSSSSEGMGIRSIASRIEFMKGSYSIDSEKGFGTTYIIDIPIKK